MIRIRHKGDFSKTTRFLQKAQKVIKPGDLDKYGQEGVAALRSATPIRSGETADSWYYNVEQGGGTIKLNFLNSHINKGVSIAIILQYGHGTGTGGYVQGRDYINPAIQPVFDRIANEMWREVTSL